MTVLRTQRSFNITPGCCCSAGYYDASCDYDAYWVNRSQLGFLRLGNPIALWEIKEYYYTTTFGSRVADGVYETLLDGMELEELREHEGIDVDHLLMVDAHYTWWDCGKSYLRRMIDMLHMGYVDEILFGYEVVERLPAIVQGWVKKVRDAG